MAFEFSWMTALLAVPLGIGIGLILHAFMGWLLFGWRYYADFLEYSRKDEQ